MDKHTFIREISNPLKELGYRKRTNYWYRAANDLIFCINVQGSQWDKDDYYVEIGISFGDDSIRYPSLLHWHCRHRCCGINGEKNMEPDEVLLYVSKMFDDIHSINDVEELLIKQHATKVVSQYWF